MSSADIAGRLVPLSESDSTIADPGADVRGSTAVDSNGEEIGAVEDLLVDEGQEKVRFLRIGAGGYLGIGKEHVLVHRGGGRGRRTRPGSDLPGPGRPSARRPATTPSWHSTRPTTRASTAVGATAPTGCPATSIRRTPTRTAECRTVNRPGTGERSGRRRLYRPGHGEGGWEAFDRGATERQSPRSADGSVSPRSVSAGGH